MPGSNQSKNSVSNVKAPVGVAPAQRLREARIAIAALLARDNDVRQMFAVPLKETQEELQLLSSDLLELGLCNKSVKDLELFFTPGAEGLLNELLPTLNTKEKRKLYVVSDSTIN